MCAFAPFDASGKEAAFGLIRFFCVTCPFEFDNVHAQAAVGVASWESKHRIQRWGSFRLRVAILKCSASKAAHRA